MKDIDLLEKSGIIKNNNLYKKVLELKDFEINSLEYEEALLLDKRSYFKYYPILLDFI